MSRIVRERLDYQPFYCEENAWRLLGRPELTEYPNWAVIVSNAARKVICLRQRAGRPVDGLIHWDYHVFCVIADPIQGCQALDIDSDLPFPCPLPSYLASTFPADAQRSGTPLFRVIKGAEYVSHLASDRSHMRRSDGSWMAPPPAWPAPGAGKPSCLMDWINMDRPSPGVRYDTKRMSSFAASSVGSR